MSARTRPPLAPYRPRTPARDFEETRRYVTTVIEQYAWYRYVYGVAEAPTIR